MTIPSAEKFFDVRITSRVEFADDLWMIRVDPGSQDFHFAPGQYATLGVDNGQGLVERAYSSYLNDIVAGSIASATGFRDALRAHPEYLEAGRYSYYIGTYLDHFPREQLLVLVFDDSRRDPAAASTRPISASVTARPARSMFATKRSLPRRPPDIDTTTDSS